MVAFGASIRCAENVCLLSLSTALAVFASADRDRAGGTGEIVGFTQAEINETPVKPKWNSLGPGIVAAATGVGAADLVATLTAGSRYGYMLLWAVVLGVIFKIVLVEGVGRWYLSTGKTIFQGWRSLGSWTSWYFGPYILIWGFVYGATAMSSARLAGPRPLTVFRALPSLCSSPAIPPKRSTSSCASITTFLPWMPVRSSSASNSASLRAPGPRLSSFSRGRASSGKPLKGMAIVFILLSLSTIGGCTTERPPCPRFSPALF
jgi:hypothetical protein